MENKYVTDWTDFVIKDATSVTKEINIDDISGSSEVELVTLNMSRYSGYDTRAYDIGQTDQGLTEQQAYDIWIADYQKNQRTFIKQIKSLGILDISQSAYDGLLLYFIINGDILTVEANEGVYDLRSEIVKKDWDTAASMIKRSNFNRAFCSRAASIIKLADYGRTKARSWMRQNGIYEMRDRNELGALTVEELRRARFAYYAETLKFLPNTPEGIKRSIAKEYEKTLVIENYTYSTTKVFKLTQTPSMTPIEKLTVEVNGTTIQHYFDFTISNNVVTITKDLKAGDIIRFTIKI